MNVASFLGCIEHDETITQAQYADGKRKLPDWLRVTDAKRWVLRLTHGLLLALR